MFRPVSLFIGLRYTRAKRRNHFISFMSFSSMIGIALGVAVLITVLSVMNGFDEEIHHRIFGMARQITVSSYNGNMNAWQTVDKELLSQPGVVATAPFVGNQGLLTNNGVVRPVLVYGIDPAKEAKVSILADKMVAGQLTALKAGGFGIVIGQKLADSLGVGLGDYLNLVTPTATVTPAGVMPRFKRFKVVGLFTIGNGFDFDTSLAYLNMQDAQTLFQMGRAISGIRIKTPDLYAAPALAKKISHTLSDNYLVSDWTQDFGAFFGAIKMEKTMMFLMLLLIVAVAAFNLVSSLVMVVNDKRADIAILRTFGATPRMILRIFIVQGATIGLIGTLLGLLGGLYLATHATAIVSAIQSLFHVQLIASDVYYVDYLPSKLDWRDVTKICVAAFGMTLLATLYPAWTASRTEPAQALRYE